MNQFRLTAPIFNAMGLVRSCLYLLFTLTALGSTAQQKKNDIPQKEKRTVPTTLLKLNKAEDSIQYALGKNIGNYLLAAGFLSIDTDYFMAGLEDIFNKRPGLLNDSIGSQILARYQEKTRRERATELEKKLFELLKEKEGVGKLPSGVQYIVVRPAKGAKPADTDSVKIHYRQRLADGTIIEDTYSKNIPVTTTPSTLFPGISEALQQMTVGSLWQVFIPSRLAFGEKGNGAIPPNSALQFEIELLEIKKPK